MFGSQRKDDPPAAPSKGATLIAANTRVVGDIHFADQLMVNGEVEGNVCAEAATDATLTISGKGSVTGEIHAPNVLINGRVNGDVYAEKHVELASEARVEGSVYYHLVEMVKGARVDGNLVYQAKTGESSTALRGDSARHARATERSGPRNENTTEGQDDTGTSAVGNAVS